MEKGTIFDIKEFAVHDGPGVRQTVFLKGCPLRCQWCHNPEGLEARPQLMFSRSSCIRCGKCMEVCPFGAAAGQKTSGSPDETGMEETGAFFPGSACTACRACVSGCPMGLRQISGKVMTSVQLADAIRENSDYYAALGGGGTFSGGDPLMQGAFLLEVLEQISDLHTAIETSAYASPQLFSRIAERLSFIMTDVKLMDPGLHKHYTGVDNTVILENLRSLCRGSKPFVVRIPLIPGVNDTRENLEATAAFLAGSDSLLRVEILPYHKTAGAKYSMLGMEYHPGFDVEAPLRMPQSVFEKYKIRSEIL